MFATLNFAVILVISIEYGMCFCSGFKLFVET